MYSFAKQITKLLNEYKLVLRKHASREEWRQKIVELGLKRKMLQQDDEVALYQKAMKVVDDISSWCNNGTTASWYSGLDEFCQHLKNAVNEYHLENNRLVHASQRASRAMIDAIQMLKLPSNKLTLVTAQKLEQNTQIVARYGSKEQQEILVKALKASQQNHSIFAKLIKSFDKYSHEFVDMLNENNAPRSSVN